MVWLDLSWLLDVRFDDGEVVDWFSCKLAYLLWVERDNLICGWRDVSCNLHVLAQIGFYEFVDQLEVLAHLGHRGLWVHDRSSIISVDK